MRLRLLLSFLALLQLASTAWAQAEGGREAEARAAFEAAGKVARPGPATIDISGQAKLVLPEGYFFVPQPEAGRLLRAWGSTGGENVTGMIFPRADRLEWSATLHFTPSGYVKDEEARTWDADALLKSLSEGVEADNAERQSHGFPAWEVRGWIEKPLYDGATHRLIWSALVTNKGEKGGTVNYNTYVLGREGFVSLDLVTDEAHIERYKTDARALLAAIAFEPGKRYTDFNASTDHVAEFGVAALIGGVAAKKLGLLAGAGLLLVKMWKLAAVAVVGGIAAVRKFFTRRTNKQA